MRAGSAALVTAWVAALAPLTGCQATVPGAPRPVSTAAPLAAPPARAALPRPAQPRSVFGGLPARLQRATDEAAADGATISVAVLDRATHQMVAKGDPQILATASVAKLFIADEVLLQESRGDITLSVEDQQALQAMLRSSDDDAAEKFWNQGGGSAIVARVASRYGLASTAPPADGRWWNTSSSVPDLIRYYDMLLDGTGGLPPELADVIISNLARSTPAGIDGYPQRFGIPEGLYAEAVAVKQGWLCCIGEGWMHLSTGVIGPDRRYVMVIESLQQADDATARATITRAVRTIFPVGRI
ncbi:hypothetical protein MSM1_00440 [Mycobacterium sp. SM1]|uniref:hypothetical protein n=1 Tax=Mycobacterium sp. SM1 TaxID=2816243 RepID=UPI001BCE045E|nr:hypothetical protein [Mycobacterium sp. SM1]MBS4726898.1 hypothetical protein [Mycobacterium sp. SM1]